MAITTLHLLTSVATGCRAAWSVCSFRVGDVAADGAHGGVGNRLPLHHRFQHVLQIMLRGFRAFLTQVGVTIVNATVINQSAVWEENRRFWRDVDLTEADQTVLRISQRLRRQLIIFEVLLNRVRRRVRVGIDQPESDTGRGKFSFNPPDFRSVTVGDRAIGADENEDENLGAGQLKGIEPVAGQIKHSGCLRSRPGAFRSARRRGWAVIRMSVAAAGNEKRQHQNQDRPWLPTRRLRGKRPNHFLPAGEP